MKKPPFVAAAILLAALAVLALMALPAAPQALSGPTVSVDTDPFAAPANTANLVGSIEPCRSVPSGSGSLDVDITIQGVASLSGIEADIFYNPAVLTVTGMQVNFILPPGFLFFNLSDPVPDSDGTFHMLLATTGEGSGDGVIVRLTLTPGADGISSLDLANVELRDVNGNPVLTAAVQDGGIAVGSSCSLDSDGDGVLDIVDNCLSVPNGLAQAAIPGVGNQTNSDFELNGLGATVNGVALPNDGDGDACDDDDDGDSSNGVTVMTQTPGAAAVTCPGGSVPVWADCVEVYLGTTLGDNCNGAPGTGIDAFPPDVDGSGTVSAGDVFAIFPSWLMATVRHDLNADGVVSAGDVFAIFPWWLISCT